MKNQSNSKITSFFFVLFFIALIPLRALYAQTAAQDSLVVRLILDQSGQLNTTVASVSTKDSANRIIGLSLDNLKITKIPTDIGVMDKLKRLVLSNNLLDSLPATLWTLDQLAVLDLSNNKISVIDTSIGHLKNLLFLSLRANGLKTVPKGIYSLPDLENLFLSHNSIDTISDSISNLPFLKYLDVANNQIRSLPLAICAMTELDTLDLAGNLLSTLPELITNLTTTNVHLGDNRLCNLSTAIDAWATQKDPSWKTTQTCGIIRMNGNAARSAQQMQTLLHSGMSIPEMLNAFKNQTNFSMKVAVTNIQGQRVFESRITQSNFQNQAATLNQLFSQSAQQKFWVQVQP